MDEVGLNPYKNNSKNDFFKIYDNYFLSAIFNSYSLIISTVFAGKTRCGTTKQIINPPAGFIVLK